MIGNDDDGNIGTYDTPITSDIAPKHRELDKPKGNGFNKNLNLESWQKKYKISMILMLKCLVNSREIKRRERNKYEGNDLNC